MNKILPNNKLNTTHEQIIYSYCINLRDKEYKFINVLNELDRLSIYPNRFVVEKHNLTKRILREGVNEKSNQILESHLKLLKHLASIDQPYFVIFEDDIKVIRDIDVNEIISSAPKDWDVIFLGGMNHYHTPKIIDHKFYKCEFSFNAHAFIVKKEFIPKIIEHLEKREYENDVIRAYMQSKGVGNWYGLIEDAIIQNGKNAKTFITTFRQNLSKFEKLDGEFDLKELKLFNKIFQIGFNKCGTTSIHQFLLNNGINSIHWEGGKIADGIIKNQSTENPLGSYSSFEAFTDFENPYKNYYPHLTHYKLLDEKYPNSIFILNKRNVDDWTRSRMNHISPNGERYVDLFRRVNKIETNEKVIEIWRNQWNQHINSVNEYFKNYDKFICFDISKPEDLIEPISKFIPLISREFPTENKT